ncbi:hypothetical protein AVU38_gp125 [Ralstonia phage RSL2]|uniref:Uncharacterized protein n=1 Tax=Ralstonia phage RSL2 TaxID=1585840 RepID=A0A0A8J9C9_9CAUD|nr:hypothetical protein AVU38_gp125 [Ralstonia phage RSL2]BAQ02653.1 hypothetical protein [Ralstonia phage RSL2]
MSPGNGTTKWGSFKTESPISPAVAQDIKQTEKSEVHPSGLTSRNRHGGQKSMNNTARV